MRENVERWQTTFDPYDFRLRSTWFADTRKERLLPIDCCRRLKAVADDTESRSALEAPEQSADRVITRDRLRLYHDQMRQLAGRRRWTSDRQSWQVAETVVRATTLSCRSRSAGRAIYGLSILTANAVFGKCVSVET